MKTTIQPPPIPRPAARLRWTFDDLVTADGHRLSVWFAAVLRMGDGPSDRKLFAEVFGQPVANALPADAIVRFLAAGLRAAAGDVAAKLSVNDAVASIDPWIAALSARANELAFGAGLEAVAPLDAGVESETLQAERLEQMRRTAADRRSADRAGQFAKAADLMKHWESLRATVPGVTPGAMLDRVDPVDRGALLETMMMASAGAGGAGLADLWIVAGPSLVRFGPGTDDKPVVVPVPSSVGPLRSVRSIDGSLWVGGRDGVMRVDPNDAEKTMAYVVPGLSSEHGFTSMVMADRRVWATHRDAGLVCWVDGRAGSPERTWSPKELGGVPGLLVEGVDDGPPVFAVGSNLYRWADNRWDLMVRADSKYVAVLNAGDVRVLVTEDGLLSQRNRAFGETVGEDRPVGRVTGAAILPWLSSHRLLLVRADGPIECIGLEDGLVTRYEGGHIGLRGVAGTAGRVAAMSADRQRVLAWDPWDGRKPVVDLHLAAVTKHRVADLVFGG